MSLQPTLRSGGEFLWEAPTPTPAPKLICYIASGFFSLLGALLLLPVLPMLVTPRDRQDLIGGIAGSVVILALAGAALWIVYRRTRPQVTRGIEFLETGIRFGPDGQRQFLSYSQLDYVRIEPVDVGKFKRARVIAGVQLVISLVTLCGAGTGHAIAVLRQKMPEGIVDLQIHGERPVRIPVEGRRGRMLLQHLQAAEHDVSTGARAA